MTVRLPSAVAAALLSLTLPLSAGFAGDLDRGTDWRVFHEPHANRFHIEIDYQSERIKLAELILPEIGKPLVGIHGGRLNRQFPCRGAETGVVRWP